MPWSELSEKLCEDMVAVLLSHLHPDSVRIDGKGGDGGRDVQIVEDEGLHAFEIKSFAGRMTDSRRAQVKRSLLTAAELHPIDWTLIVPIDFTDGEIKWFNGLRELVAFPIDRKGLTWLDARFAERPHIARYFLEDAAHEVIRLAEVLNQERAVLAGGAPDAVERAGAVVDQLNQLDPFYRFEITVGEGVRSVRVIPRYRGAQRDRPITGKFAFRFPGDDAGRAAAEAFEQALDFGKGAKVPAEYIEEVSLDLPAGLRGTIQPTSIEIGPSEAAESKRTIVLAVFGPDAQSTVELALDFERTSVGRRGSIWKAVDRTGALSVELEADVRDGKVRFRMSFAQVASYYPHEFLPVVRFLAALRPGVHWELRNEDGETIGQPTPVTIEPMVEPWVPRLVADLVLVQAASGAIRRVPIDVSGEEIRGVAAYAALLRGEEVPGTWEQLVVTVSDTAPDAYRAGLHAGIGPVTMITDEPQSVTYGGVEYSLGRRVRMEYQSVRLGGVVRRTEAGYEIDDIPAEWNDVVPVGAEVVLVPGETNEARLSLLSDIAGIESEK